MREQEHAMYDTYIALKEAAEARVNKEKQITEQRKKEAADFYEGPDNYQDIFEIIRQYSYNIQNSEWVKE